MLFINSILFLFGLASVYELNEKRVNDAIKVLRIHVSVSKDVNDFFSSFSANLTICLFIGCLFASRSRHLFA